VLDVAGNLARRRALFLDRGCDRGGDVVDLADGGGDVADRGTPSLSFCMSPICWRISSVAFAVWLARLFTSGDHRKAATGFTGAPPRWWR
jgi:hypothetical protein